MTAYGPPERLADKHDLTGFRCRSDELHLVLLMKDIRRTLRPE
ncbi:hypothetical protein ACAG26_14590 [Mycobacterium sp. pUA109]